MLNGAGESQDLLCTDKSSSTIHLLKAKKNFECYKIESSSCKDLFHMTDQLSGKKKDSTLPNSIPTVDLPDTFGDFFSTKIQMMRDELDATSRQPDFSVFCGPTLETSFVTEQQVKNITLKAPKEVMHA